jgi:hypothetical protein
MAGQIAEAIALMQLMKHETHIAQGSGVDLHDNPLRRAVARSTLIAKGLPVVSIASMRAMLRGSRTSVTNCARSIASRSSSVTVSTRSKSPPLSTWASLPATTSS